MLYNKSAVLALLTVLLSTFTTIEEFAYLSAHQRIVSPIAQSLGALYALFISLPVLTPGTKRDTLWREMNALATLVLMLGFLIAVTGAICGFMGIGWLGFKSGLGVVVLGIATVIYAITAPLRGMHEKAS